MTVYSHQPGFSAARPPAYPRHLVTAVIVSHDGARWLPQALGGLLGQDRQVQRILAVDTGSSDNSPQILQEKLGDWLPESGPLILGRRSGFGTAVAQAVFNSEPLQPEDLPYSLDPSGYDPVTGGFDDFGHPLGQDDEDEFGGPGPRETQPVEWLWLLHDDCEPHTDALRRLLQVADSTPSTGVVGPKLRSWYDRRQLLEVGVTIARSGRRWTGLDRREQDQGQHDQIRPVLSVSSAGMLVRRDVFEELGGFDKALPLMRDDVDFCWRVNAAGHRVVVAPDAVMRHAEAASRERRAIDCAGNHPHRVDKAGAIYTLLANSKRSAFLYVLLRLMVGTLMRVIANLVGKDPRQAYDEIAGLNHELVRLPRLLLARKRRKRTRVADGLDDRTLFPAPGATARLQLEQAAAALGIGGGDNSGRHGSLESGPGEDDTDDLQVEQFALLKKLIRRPAPVLFAGVLVFALIACRSLLGSTGYLLGGALLPTPDGAAGLWHMYADAWHPVGTGSTTASPPYLAVLAVLSSVLLGDAALLVKLLLVLSVPLAALTAYVVSRPLVRSKLVRAWAAAAYALLPAVTGSIAQGRLGTAVFAVLLPPLARAAAISFGLGITAESAERGLRPGWRSTWTTVLLLTVSTAFVPLTWAVAVPVCLAFLAYAVLRGGAYGSGGQALRSLGLRIAAMLVVSIGVLAPWSLSLLLHPSRLLLEAGMPGFSGHAAGPIGLLLLNPAGSGVPPIWMSAGVVLTALAALLRVDRRRAVLAAWAAAVVGLLVSAVVAGTAVTPASGGAATAAWAGPATLLAGVALLAAAAVGADGSRARVANAAFGWRQPVAGLVMVIAALAPVGSALWWAVSGVGGPLHRGSAAQVPAFLAVESTTAKQSRTLVLNGDADAVNVGYSLVRGPGLTLGQAEGTVDTHADQGLDKLTGQLLAGSGGDLAGTLAGYGVGYVEAKGAMIDKVRPVLDTTPGLTRMSEDAGIAVWQVSGAPGVRAVITQPKGAPSPLPAGAVDVNADVPAGPDGRVVRLAEKADPKWEATLDDKPLEAVTLDDGFQGFKLPTDGGKLVITRGWDFVHVGWIAGQLLLGATILVLALPTRRSHKDDDLPDEELEALAASAEPPAPGSRRARRLAERGEGGESGEAFEDGAAEAGVHIDIPAQATGEPEHEDAFAAGSGDYADPYQAHYGDGSYHPDQYDYAQQPAGTPYGEGQYHDPQYAEPYAQQGYDPYGNGYHQPEQQPWAPGQPQHETYYDPNDPYGHQHHYGSGS